MLKSFLTSALKSTAVRSLSQEVLMAMDPEVAHRTTISALKMGLVPAQSEPDAPELATQIAGLQMSNPVGMAAGFDKNAEVPNALGRIGFGAVEVGTITPRAQEGNPKPRLFRLPEHFGVINRMGFNNAGHDEALERLKTTRTAAILGINIGANKDSEDFVEDYVLGVREFSPFADYLTANISSPNTPGLRNLQSGEALKRLLGEVLAERSRAKIRVPVFLKIAPDLDEVAMDEITAVIQATDLDGVIVSNTTLSRDTVSGAQNAEEMGGLSGKPLFNLATQRLAQMRLRLGTEMPIIGVGGIHSAQSAIAKLEAGADAIQLYSALVFGGMDLLEEIKTGLIQATQDAGATRVGELTGRNTQDWADGKMSL